MGASDTLSVRDNGLVLDDFFVFNNGFDNLLNGDFVGTGNGDGVHNFVRTRNRDLNFDGVRNVNGDGDVDVVSAGDGNGHRDFDVVRARDRDGVRNGNLDRNFAGNRDVVGNRHRLDGLEGNGNGDAV